MSTELKTRVHDALESLRNSIPEIRRIVGMRNRIIHGYDSVDDEIVWDAVQHHVPALRSALQRIR